MFRIVPKRLQFFELESVFFHCEGLDGASQLKGIRNTEILISVCDESSPTLLCAIHRAYATDSGEYWCETAAGEKSISVNITITRMFNTRVTEIFYYDVIYNLMDLCHSETFSNIKMFYCYL